jgi:hypothetical protein
MSNSYLGYVTAVQQKQTKDISQGVAVIEWDANYVKLDIISPEGQAFVECFQTSHEPVTVIYGPQGNALGAIRHRAKFQPDDYDGGILILRRISDEIKDVFY